MTKETGGRIALEDGGLTCHHVEAVVYAAGRTLPGDGQWGERGINRSKGYTGTEPGYSF